MSNNLKFSINSTSESPAKTIVNVRGFSLTVDEPAELGGTDVAPNPVEYILAGYAGCINVVAHIVAKELDITLNDLKVDIEGYLNPNRLFGVSSSERAGYTSIQVKGISINCLRPLALVSDSESRRGFEDRLVAYQESKTKSLNQRKSPLGII